MMQTIATLALAAWALISDPHVQLDNVDRFPPPSAFPHCTAYTYVIAVTVGGEWCGFDALHVARCGLAVHDAPRPCDPRERIFVK